MTKTRQTLTATIALAMACAASSGQAQKQQPVPGKLETYRDWIIGCDNGERCQAVSLVPGDGADWDKAATISITRDSGGMVPPEARFHLQSATTGPVDVMVDGKRVARASGQADELSFTSAEAYALVQALARGTRLELVSDGKAIGEASLNGSAAALRYMDARQGRAGTLSALIATGRLGVGAVRKPPALPMVTYLAAPAGASAALWQTERTSAYALADCTSEYDPAIEASVHRLDAGHELVLVPCGAGAYNYNRVALIATGKPGRRQFSLARFDFAPGWGPETAMPMLVNAMWDAKASTLTSYAKGRGLGDCGNSETYVWNGHMFRLIKAASMGECRGAWDWITTFRAQPRAKR